MNKTTSQKSANGTQESEKMGCYSARSEHVGNNKLRKNNKLDIRLLTGSCTRGNTVVATKHTKMNFTSKDSIAGTIRFSDSSFQFIAGLDNYCFSRAFEITIAESKHISLCREPE